MPEDQNALAEPTRDTGDRESEEHSLSVPAEVTLELVEDAIVLVQVAKLASQVIMDVNRPEWLALHVHVPNLERQVVTSEDIPSVPTEPDIRYRRNDFGEERAICGILFLFEFYRMGGNA